MEIGSSISNDDIQQLGTHMASKELLTIYTVKTNTNPEEVLNVVILDEL